jgi:GNAT superfamily N-acetyltransferase
MYRFTEEMKLKLNLLPAEEKNAEALVELRIAAMRESLECIGRFDAQRARERFLAGFMPQHTKQIEKDGRRVGFVVVKPTDDGLLLDHLYVHPDFQRQGIGRWALQQVFDGADDRCRAIKVGALKDSDSNRFYIRHGFNFVEQAEWDNYYVRTAANAV